MVDSGQAVSDQFRDYLNRHPEFRAVLPGNPSMLRGLAHDFAPGDPALHNALEALAQDRRLGEVLLGPVPPTNQTWAALVAGAASRGIRDDSLWRAVRVLQGAYFGQASTPAAPPGRFPLKLLIGVGAAVLVVLGIAVAFGSPSPGQPDAGGGAGGTTTPVASPSVERPGSSPSVPSPGGESTPGDTSALTGEQIIDRLNGDPVDKSSCEVSEETPSGSAVSCDLVSGEAPYFVRVSSYSSASDLDAAVASWSTRLVTSPGCPDSDTWHYESTPEEPEGSLACGTDAGDEGFSRVIWSYSAELLLVEAMSEELSSEELFSWWKGVDPVKRS